MSYELLFKADALKEWELFDNSIRNQFLKKLKERLTNDNKAIHSKALVFRISASIMDTYGKYIKNVNLGGWPCKPYGYSINSLVEDESFIRT